MKKACTKYLDENAQPQPLNDQVNNLIDDVINKYATKALRTIVIAYKDIEAGENGVKHDEPVTEDVKDIETSGLTLIGVIGIMDVIREEVPKSVEDVTAAGVTVRMVTGDNIVTARAIAHKCKILDDEQMKDEECCVLGPKFYEDMGGLVRKLKDKPSQIAGDDVPEKDIYEEVRNIRKFEVVKDKVMVMARARPEDKYLLVTALRNFEEVVAVTGDGTNDAPALTKADVGFGMGRTGTQVCRAAADIIITDDSFTSVVKACMWGRNVFDNIQRFLQFQLTVNVNALLTVFICSALMKGTPLQAIQLLWVNLIMDSLAALALATEMPKEHLMKRPPQQRKDFIVSRKMMKHIIYMSIYQFFLVGVFVFAGEYIIPEDEEFKSDPNQCCVDPGREYSIDGEPLWYAVRQVNGNQYSRHITFIFHQFVFLQIWNMVCSRKIHDELNVFEGILTNWTFLVIWVIIVALQFVIINYGGRVFRISTAGLNWQQHVLAMVSALSVFVVNFILKFVPDKYGFQMGPDSVYDRACAQKQQVQQA